MDSLNKIYYFIKNLDKQEALKYLLASIVIILSIFALMFYLHYYRVDLYLKALEKVKTERKKTSEILTKNKLVLQQRQKVEEILTQDKGIFILAEAFENIVKNLNLFDKLEAKEKLTTTGDIISDKIEQKLTTVINKITTKDLTNLLKEIAKIERIYPKELKIDKNNDQTINIEITIATLEPAPKK